jgi:hypothetical protein
MDLARSNFRMGCAAELASHLAHTSVGPISNIDDKVRRILPKISRFF